MNTRTPLAPETSPTRSGTSSPQNPGPAGLDEDTRRFSQLTPLEQLERLEADGRRVKERERVMREAERQLDEKG